MEEISAKVFFQRAVKICSDKKLLDEELDIIKHNLCEVNNYSRKFVHNYINYNLHQRNTIAPNLNEGNNSKEIFINPKYAGRKGEQLLSKMKKIVSNSLEDGVKPKVVYNLAKLSQYINVEDSVPQKYKINLVYKCTFRC